MTQDQIKAIAEEYTKEYSYHNDVAEDAIELLNWLNTRYCMVEREKVMRAIRILQNDADMSEFKAECDGAISVLQNLFGTSMFNQDEE